MKRGPWMAVLALLGLTGCADLWGFDDLTNGPLDGAASDSSSDGHDEKSDVVGDAPSDEVDGGSAADAADASIDAADATGPTPADAGDSGIDAGGRDSGPDAMVAICNASTCAGCCDPLGKCLAGTAVAACGTAGGMCTNCAATKCSGLTASNCCTNSACACATVCGL